MSLTSTLREASDRNHELLTELAETDYAPSSLKQNASYISDLKTQIASTDKELARLHTITEDEKKDHVKYRDSNVKRWAYKLQGEKGRNKFSSKQEKEEREFLEAWQKERSAKESRQELAQALEQAEKDHVKIESDNKHHEGAQQQLDELYRVIFSGPTPEVPGEDDLEQSVEQAKAQLNQTLGQFSNEKLAMEALSSAEQSLKMAYSDIEAALRRSARDMFGGGTFTDMMERDALANAQNNVNGTIRHMDGARKYQPAIRPLTEITIDQGHFMSDVMFDNIFTDMAQHDRIQNTQAQMVQAMQSFKRQVTEQRQRVASAESATKQAQDGLENRRKELQRVRAEAFERLTGSGNDNAAPPPPYQAQQNNA